MKSWRISQWIFQRKTQRNNIIKREKDEKYEKDINALKKRLDFLNNSNCRLIESTLKHNNFKPITRNYEASDRSQTASVYTERISTDENYIEEEKNMNDYHPKDNLTISRFYFKILASIRILWEIGIWCFWANIVDFIIISVFRTQTFKEYWYVKSPRKPNKWPN